MMYLRCSKINGNKREKVAGNTTEKHNKFTMTVILWNFVALYVMAAWCSR